ncbi:MULTISPECIES: succinate dehydrogenase [Acidiplasma]|uniref:Succinate dehydrogenase n=1 Tax=Acidiplasma aeolicum TaxID=507754 RepID=A0A0N8PQJ2_9ARCH|nr:MULTISPECIES: succinate dehydrogenase [Acidiplasma]KPV47277.1 hypothetical protein SE19_01730 [Acidiplasma aeolicum]
MDDLKNLMKGVEVTDVKGVSRKPGEKPFATEIFYKKGDLFNGKLHVRKSDGKMYLSIISKIPFNWKNLVGNMKFAGQVVDSAGGLLWLKETENTLNIDLEYIEKYLNELKEKKVSQ